MRSESILRVAGRKRSLAGLVLAVLAWPAGVARAQAGPEASSWRLGAAAGAYSPRSALIKTTGAADTRLGAGPSFGLDLQYLANDWLAVYAGAATSFNTLAAGTAISPAAVAPSTQVTLAQGTGGLLLTIPAEGWLGGHLQPTIRVGGGIKWYSFDLTGSTSQWRPTWDFGIGFRGVGAGPLEVAAEVRYLPSSFDQSKLPVRGIVPQDQRQNDLLLTVGIAIRP